MTREEEEFDVKLHGDETLGMVIRAHLIAERTVYKLLSEALAAPKAIDLDRLTFLVKVKLAVAMGLMPEYSVSCFTVLNSIRNKFAHDASYTFIDKDKGELLSAMPAHAVQVAMEEEEGIVYSRENVPVEKVLRVAVCLIEAFRQDAKAERAAAADARKRLREAIDKSRNTLASGPKS